MRNPVSDCTREALLARIENLPVFVFFLLYHFAPVLILLLVLRARALWLLCENPGFGVVCGVGTGRRWSYLGHGEIREALEGCLGLL